MFVRTIFLLFLSTALTFAQWIPQTNTDTRCDFHHLKFIDAFHGWIVGDSGSIYFTGDNGKSWTKQHTEVQSRLRSISVIDSLRGWAGGDNNTLLITHDGGTTWNSRIFYDTTITLHVQSLFFTDSSNGWGTAIQTSVPPTRNSLLSFKTTDGGLQWVRFDIDTPYFASLGKIQFTDPKHGWVLGTKKIYRTTDGGIHWSAVYHPTVLTTDFDFIDSLRGFRITNYLQFNRIEKTTDGGLTWNVDSTTMSNLLIFPSIDFIDSVFGCISYGGVTYDNFTGSVLITRDGGATWELKKKIAGATLNNIAVIDSLHVVGIGLQGGKIYSIDGGRNWVDLSPPRIAAIDFRIAQYLSPTNIWAASYGSLHHSLNGGKNWNTVFLPTGIGINGIFFVDSTHGWVVDDSARIFSTQNGGTLWNEQTSGYSNQLFSLHFVDTSYGISVGRLGQATITLTGGTQWSPKNTGTTNDLHDVFLASLTKGWAVGKSGIILLITDRGETWTPQISPTTVTLRSVSFNDSLNGYIVGDSGIILITTNGGAVWSLKNSEGSQNLHSVKTVGSSVWAVGANGTIVYSEDYGTKWLIQSSNTTNLLRSVDFVNVTDGIIVGNGGIVLTTKNSGVTHVETYDAGKVVSKYHLGQNYPNPFNPVTRISLEIQKAGRIKLTVYDILGREVITLLHESDVMPGSYTVPFNGSAYTSGIYFYRLTTESYTVTKKMTLVK